MHLSLRAYAVLDLQFVYLIFPEFEYDQDYRRKLSPLKLRSLKICNAIAQ